MTRDEMEAAIWKALRPGRTAPALRVVDEILHAADEYAAGQGSISALHRQGLDDATHLIHYQHPAVRTREAICTGRRTTARTTTNPARVNCDECKKSHAWQDALAVAS